MKAEAKVVEYRIAIVLHLSLIPFSKEEVEMSENPPMAMSVT